jgi:hypothetical protein
VDGHRAEKGEIRRRCRDTGRDGDGWGEVEREGLSRKEQEEQEQAQVRETSIAEVRQRHKRQHLRVNAASMGWRRRLTQKPLTGLVN